MFRPSRTALCTLCSLFIGVIDAAHSQEPLQLQREDQRLVGVIAYASAVPTCQGIAVISPGAGGTEKGYRYLAEAMSTLGYLSVVVGHQESGRRALREHIRGNGLREGLAELITNPDAYLGRFMDIAAAKRWAETRCPARSCGSDVAILGIAVAVKATALVISGGTPPPAARPVAGRSDGAPWARRLAHPSMSGHPLLSSAVISRGTGGRVESPTGKSLWKSRGRDYSWNSHDP